MALGRPVPTGTGRPRARDEGNNGSGRLGGDTGPGRARHTASGTAWISSAVWPARSWMRWTASAEGAVDRQ